MQPGAHNEELAGYRVGAEVPTHLIKLTRFTHTSRVTKDSSLRH